MFRAGEPPTGWRRPTFDDPNDPLLPTGVTGVNRQLVLATIAAAVVMFPLDFLWLRTMRPFYESQMGSIMLS